jgi:hypothetical protein
MSADFSGRMFFLSHTSISLRVITHIIVLDMGTPNLPSGVGAATVERCSYDPEG